MTQLVNPSLNRPTHPHQTAGIIAEGGASLNGFVFDGSQPTDIATFESDISEGNLAAFNHVSSSSLDVTIDAGEASIYGAWVAKDTQTTVSLADNTSNQTVYVGWNKDSSDDVQIGLSGAFQSEDPKIPIWDFDTSGGSVTGSTDRRVIGKTVGIPDYSGADLTIYDYFNDQVAVEFNEGGIVNFNANRIDNVARIDWNDTDSGGTQFVFGEGIYNSGKFDFGQQGGSAVNQSLMSLTNGDPGTLEILNVDVVPGSAGTRNIGTASLYFNEMHATAFQTHSPEPRDFDTAMESVRQYASEFGSMEIGEQVADLVTVINRQQDKIEQLEAELEEMKAKSIDGDS